MSDTPIPRSAWSEVLTAFMAFFAALGEVGVEDGTVSFEAPETGLSVSSDGTSESFMPLHGLSLTWDTIAFDAHRWEVRLVGPGGTYTYVVPPSLRPNS
ncbi:hypothetical protein ACFLQ7_00040 [Actinomycetota bacterium]